jgi:phage shock protein PspC (stress-responsive transcriptional regulator)
MTAPFPPDAPLVDQPPPGPAVRPSLRRSRSDKVAGGVAGGLAEYSGVDPLLWRVGFVALTLAGGTGIAVYLLLWLLMPAGPRDPAVPAVTAGPSLPRSPVAVVTVAALLIVGGVMALVTRVTDLDAGPRGFLAGALLVVGLGLVASAFTRGRAPRGGLIALGSVLTLALLFASSVPDGVDDDGDFGVGDRTYRPATAAAVQDRYQGGVGDLEIDLTDIDPSTIDRSVIFAVEHGVGDVDILVPEDADVFVSGQGGIGEVEFDGDNIPEEGALYPGEGDGDWVDDGRAEFRILVSNGIGDVEVSRD